MPYLRTFIKTYIVTPLHFLLGWVLIAAGLLLASFRSSRTNYVLIVDHSLGGGTNLYRNNRILELLRSADKNVLLVTNFHFGGSNSAFKIEHRTVRKSFSYYVSKKALLRSLGRYEIEKVECNSIVFFNDQPFFLSLLEELARVKQVQMAFFVHDYYSLCPEYQLMYKERFCNLECEKNKCVLKYPFTSIGVDLQTWRDAWLDFLNRCDEIVFFSESSMRLLRRIYPTIAPTKIRLVPHSMGYFVPRPAKTSPSQDTTILRVAAIGGVTSVAKGSKVVADLVSFCFRSKIKIEFLVLGTFDHRLRLDTPITVTGPYEREQLSELLVTHGVHIALFPSVWPETFSYLVSELMLLEVPVVSFDIGAQGEKVLQYDRGIVCASADPEEIVQNILSLSERLGLSASPSE